MATGGHHWPGDGGITDRGHCHGGAAAWAEEFAEFAASRRSLSDFVAFVEVAPVNCDEGGEFDRLDDDQLMSMFPDEGGSALWSENGSSDSDGDKHGAVAGTAGCKDRYDYEQNEAAPQDQLALGQAAAASSELIPYHKRVKTQEVAGVRKLQYISELEFAGKRACPWATGMGEVLRPSSFAGMPVGENRGRGHGYRRALPVPVAPDCHP